MLQTEEFPGIQGLQRLLRRPQGHVTPVLPPWGRGVQMEALRGGPRREKGKRGWSGEVEQTHSFIHSALDQELCNSLCRRIQALAS